MHKNNDNAEEKPTGSRVMRVKVFDEKVSCEAKRWRSKKGGEAKKVEKQKRSRIAPQLFPNSFHSSDWQVTKKNWQVTKKTGKSLKKN